MTRFEKKMGSYSTIAEIFIRKIVHRKSFVINPNPKNMFTLKAVYIIVNKFFTEKNNETCKADWSNTGIFNHQLPLS